MKPITAPKRLALSAAIATALLTGYGGRKAYAGSITGTDPTFTLSGGADGGGNDTQLTLYSNLANAITLTTTAGFGHDSGNNGGDGLNVVTGAATTGLTITDNNGSALTGFARGLYARHGGNGSLSITSSGTVTGTTSRGLHARNFGTDLSITADTVTGGDDGIFASNYGSGSLSITSSEIVTGAIDDGVEAVNIGTDLTINAANVSGGGNGVRAHNYGSGSLSITSSGTVTGTNNYGILARNHNGTDLTINAATVSGDQFGILARNYGSGALSITSSDTVTSGTGTNNYGIFARNNNGTDLTINTANLYGAGIGVFASNSGNGALSITSNGTVTGTNFIGILARNHNGTDLTITAATVSGGYAGIDARNYDSGALSITSSSIVTGTNGNGIDAQNFGSGALSITSSSTVTGGTGTNDEGIYARNHGTDLSITAANVSGSDGVFARNNGSGALSITTSGRVAGGPGLSDDGIYALNTGTDLTIHAATVSGGGEGIDARNQGSGALSITTTSTVTGLTDDGIYALNIGTDLTINAASVSGENTGISALGLGSGALSITTSGTTSGSILAINLGTDLTINAASISEGHNGITASNSGSGALSITTTTGTVTGTTGYGIFARNYGTDLNINAASASGGVNGIFARNYGTGAVSITSSGAVIGTTYYGIFARNFGTDLTIHAAGATGGDSGVRALNHGSGTLSITTSGAITGGTGAGINAYTSPGRMSQITLNAGTTVSAASGVAIVNTIGDSLTTVNAGAAVIGDIILGDGSDTLIFDGGDFSQVTLFDGGDDADIADGFIDSLTLGGVGVLDTSLLVNWEEINIGGNVTFADGIFAFPELTIGNGASLAGGAGFTFTGDLTIGNGGTLDAGSAFQIIGDLFLNAGGTLDSTGNSPSNTVITGNFTNAGLITMADAETNDTVTITGNYTSAGGTLELDTQLNDGVIDITDTLTINGDSAGATQVTVNNVGGTGGDTDTGNPTTDGIQIIQVDGVSSGTFTLANTVSAGAFTYGLVQADGQNWFLQSTGLVDQLFGYSALASAIHDQLEPLRQRDHRGQLVNLDGQISNSGSGFWSRVSYSETEADASNSVGTIKVDSELEYERSKLQVGYDQTLRADNKGTLIAGVFGHYQDLDLESDDALTGAKQADAEAQGWGVGASVTYYATSGWYGDAMVQVTDYDIEVDGASGSEADTDALNWSVSVEGGYAFDLGNDLTITPQVQLLWQQTDFDKVTDSTGVTAKWAQRDSLTARAGVALERDFMVGESPITGYVDTDVVQVISDASDVEVNGVNVKTQLNRTRLDLRVGGQHISADKQLVIYAELGASEALNSRDYQRIDATAGVRWRY